MIKIKPFLIATLLLTGFALPATAQIGEARSNLSVGVNGGVNLNSVSFTPSIKQNSLMGITGGLTARYISEKYFAMICGAQVELDVYKRQLLAKVVRFSIACGAISFPFSKY